MSDFQESRPEPRLLPAFRDSHQTNRDKHQKKQGVA
jgi:hypothetical protein